MLSLRIIQWPVSSSDRLVQPPAEDFQVCWLFKDGRVLQETERLPSVMELMARVRYQQDGLAKYPDAVNACGLMLARIQETAIRRVLRAVQEDHWPWLAGVDAKALVRFERKLERRWTVPLYVNEPWTAHPCEMWTGAKSVGGQKGSSQKPYGSFWIGKNSVRAHIFSALVRGTSDGLPHVPGQHVDHLCREPLCVAKQHLMSVPPLENIARRWGRDLEGQAGQGVSPVDVETGGQFRPYHRSLWTTLPLTGRGQPADSQGHPVRRVHC